MKVPILAAIGMNYCLPAPSSIPEWPQISRRPPGALAAISYVFLLDVPKICVKILQKLHTILDIYVIFVQLTGLRVPAFIFR
jgi:hypothetical protein